MGKTEQFEKLLNKFRFTRPVPPELRRRISRNKKKQFAVILKKTGGYSISFGIVASLFFSLKKLGMGVSIIKTAVILATATTAAAALIATGVYSAVKHMDKLDEKDKSVMGMDKQAAPLTEIKEPAPAEAADSPEAIARRIGVRVFTADKADKNLSIIVTDAIADELALLRGKEFTYNIRKNTDEKRYRMLLVGSVEHRAGVFTVAARVSDVRDSHVIFYASEDAASAEEITAAGKSIARKIANAVPAGKTAPLE